MPYHPNMDEHEYRITFACDCGTKVSISKLPASAKEAIPLLEEFRILLQAQRRSQAEDAILEVMDMVTGWITPKRGSGAEVVRGTKCAD